MAKNLSESIPLKLPKSFDDFKKDFNSLCDEYGYWQHFVVVAEADTQEESDFHAFWGTPTTGLVDVIEDILEERLK